MTIQELDGRLTLKWAHPPGPHAESVLRAGGFVWNQGMRAWEKEAKPGLKDAILTALGYRPAPPCLTAPEMPARAIVAHPITYRVTGEWKMDKKEAHKAIAKYMRLLKLPELPLTVEEYENKEKWISTGYWKCQNQTGPVYPIKGKHLIYRHNGGMVAFQVEGVMFCHDKTIGTKYIIDKSFMKKGTDPKVRKENENV